MGINKNIKKISLFTAGMLSVMTLNVSAAPETGPMVGEVVTESICEEVNATPEYQNDVNLMADANLNYSYGFNVSNGVLKGVTAKATSSAKIGGAAAKITSMYIRVNIVQNDGTITYNKATKKNISKHSQSVYDDVWTADVNYCKSKHVFKNTGYQKVKKYLKKYI